MPRKCSICTHPDKLDIEVDILSNVPFRTIATKYNVGRHPLKRHFDNGHISPETIQAEKLRKIAYSENLLEKLMYLQNEALKVLDEAKDPEDGKPLTILSAIGRLHGMIETQAKLDGRLKELEINILINPTWIALKQEIFLALKPFPDAQAAVFAAVAGGDLSDVQKQMIEGDRGYKDVTPGVMEIIEKEFQKEPEQPPELSPPEIHKKKVKPKPPQPEGLQPTRR